MNLKLTDFGFATSNTFPFFDTRADTFKEKVQKISPQVLRFPGGAVGNFYHFDKAAYGMKIKEIDSLITGKFPKRARGLISYSKKKGHVNNYIDDFIALAKFSNSRAVLVANVLTEKTEDILNMIQKIKDSGIEIIGVELGSELSNKSYFDKGLLIDDYIKKSELISNAIKISFPEILTAVVAAPLLENKNHRHYIWNKKLSHLSFYDAIIVHSYAKVVKGKDQYGQMILEENEGEKESSFLIYKKRVLDFFKDYYPKEIPITELVNKKDLKKNIYNCGKKNIKLLVILSLFFTLFGSTIAYPWQGFFDGEGNLILSETNINIWPDKLGLSSFWFPAATIKGEAIYSYFGLDALFRAIGMMLLGVILFRTKVLSGSLNIKIYKRMIFLGLVLGIPLGISSLLWLGLNNYSPDVAIIGFIPNKLGIIPMTIAYIGILSILNKKISPKAASFIRACGRMGFTNYITQTLLCAAFLNVLLKDVELTRKEIILFVILVWTIQIVWSKFWLDKFDQGPLEYLWRKLTYGFFKKNLNEN